MTNFRRLALGVVAAVSATFLHAQATPTPADHYAAVNERGDHVMGFDHDKTITTSASPSRGA